MKVRIISGVVGAILAVAILLLHKTFVFPLAIAALICIALFELFRAGSACTAAFHRRRFPVRCGTAVFAVLRKLYRSDCTDIPVHHCHVCGNGSAA